MTDKPKAPPLWTPGAAGIWHATLAGRSWTLTEPTGSTAWAAYAALQARLAALGLYSGDPVRFRAALVGFMADPDVLRLARQAVDWMACDGVPVASGFDRVFTAGRVAEVAVLAREAWNVLDFFLAPGQRPDTQAAVPSPPPSPTPGAV